MAPNGQLAALEITQRQPVLRRNVVLVDVPVDGLRCRVDHVDLNRPVALVAGPLRIDSLDQRSENVAKRFLEPFWNILIQRI